MKPERGAKMTKLGPLLAILALSVPVAARAQVHPVRSQISTSIGILAPLGDLGAKGLDWVRANGTIPATAMFGMNAAFWQEAVPIGLSVSVKHAPYAEMRVESCMSRVVCGRRELSGSLTLLTLGGLLPVHASQSSPAVLLRAEVGAALYRFAQPSCTALRNDLVDLACIAQRAYAKDETSPLLYTGVQLRWGFGMFDVAGDLGDNVMRSPTTSVTQHDLEASAAIGIRVN